MGRGAPDPRLAVITGRLMEGLGFGDDRGGGVLETTSPGVFLNLWGFMVEGPWMCMCKTPSISLDILNDRNLLLMIMSCRVNHCCNPHFLRLSMSMGH